MATMSTVWDRAAEFLSNNRATLTPIVVLGLFVPLSLLGNLMPLVATAGPVGGPMLGIVLVLLSIVTVWGGLVITALAFDPAGGRAVAVETANRRLLPVLGIGILTAIGFVALTLPIAFALGLSGINPTALAAGSTAIGTPNAGAVLFIAFYSLFLVALILWLSARLALVNPTLVMERRGVGVYARSFALTHGIAWKIVGVLLLYIVVSQVAAIAARTVFGAVFGLLIRGEGTITLASVLTALVVAAVSTIFSVLAVAFIAKLYLATRDAREAIVEGARGAA